MHNYPIRPITPQSDEEMLAALTASVVIAKAKRGTPLTESEQAVAQDILVAHFAEQLDGLTADDFADTEQSGIEEDPED